MKYIVNVSLIWPLFLLFCLSCSKKNSSTPGGGGVITEDNDPLKVYPYIIGDVTRLDTAKPLPNYTVVIYDVSSGESLTARTNESGVFEIPMDALSEERSYQLYLLDAQDNYLAGIAFDDGTNLSSPTPITYNTFDDFDLGHLKIAYGNDGKIDLAESQLQGSLGAGFSLKDDLVTPVTLGSIFPDWIGDISFKRGVYAFDPQVLLFHYLGQNSLNMSYQNFQTINLTLTPASDATLLSAFAISSGNWQSEIKDSKNLRLERENAPLWQTNSAAFTLREENTLAATLYADATLAEAKIFFISAFEQGGDTQNFPIKLSFSDPINPPILVAANESGATETILDFSDTDMANGLTRPFCTPSGDFVLGMKSPTLLDSEAKQIFEHINLQFVYYDDEFIPLEYQLNDWPDEWQTTTESSITQGTVHWFPEEALWSILLSDTEKQKSSHAVTIPQIFFLSNLAAADTGVSYIKVILSYENSTHISAASYWFTFCNN